MRDGYVSRGWPQGLRPFEQGRDGTTLSERYLVRTISRSLGAPQCGLPIGPECSPALGDNFGQMQPLDRLTFTMARAYMCQTQTELRFGLLATGFGLSATHARRSKHLLT